ncbi:Exodeoxyribonuclease VII large subunit [Nitrosomonas aestuarii]|uniref:Exodeoxyribonuclease 7 large subunit n=1 Tax=Nitrosomonas aestuarii TaxID=52441 RepID=A0A1I3YDL9_9PROT|nr:exodeoxyribonuclease VII large subunit [Nitrosomonas aestuarii]SFK29902.1 Exodeoxyribonuclease VII large subunit [Nitrosomonas aestuarii]
MQLSPKLEISHKIITVSELNRHAKTVLENTIPLLWVNGEISNLKQYPSGHWYFSLKDTHAQVRCVMFRHKNQYIEWQPQEGGQVEVLALVTLYETRGDFQLNVETMRRAGLGALFEKFEKLKTRLEQDGLFDAARKKKIPTFPRQIGIITSPATAALHDVITTLRRRMPMLPIVIYSTPVQGKDVAKSIAASIATASRRRECDILILCRGGGSIEDLWAFNEELVAQAIAACTIPVISGIGHETDFTIADFVADIRAPTPTGAAELASPEMKELQQQLNRQYKMLQHTMLHHLENRMQRVDLLAHRLIHPGERINNQFAHLQHLRERLTGNWTYQIESKFWKIKVYEQRILSNRPDFTQLTEQQSRLTAQLQQAFSHYVDLLVSQLQHRQVKLTHLNPQSILDRGYSITYSLQDTVVRNVNQIHIGDKIQVKFAQGQIDAAVIKIKKR